MNQIPPNEHDAHDADRRQAPNPYARREYAGDANLDGEAPYLQAEDVQRLNRKALVFLAAIVVALIAIAAWLIFGDSADDAVATRPASEEVIIPAAPRDLPELPPERAVAQVPAAEELPPLPVIDDNRTSQSSNMPSMDSLRSQAPSLLERRMEDAGGGGMMGGGAPEGGQQGGLNPQDYAAMLTGQGQQSSVRSGPAEGLTSAQPLYKPDTLLLRGTYIRCVLQSRVISDYPGYTSCIVTEPVYSVNGKRLLLPRGSKVQGSYGRDELIGERVNVAWDRVTTPNGLDINMTSPGVDVLGSAGHPGHYTAHWGQRITSALLISILSDAFKYAAAENGPPQTSVVNGAIVQNPYESSTARTMERMANMALDRNMSRPPTVTINQGTVVAIYVSRDVDFSSVIR
ncbi:hypothetical protein LU699_12770 [Luteimonas fraxinea]|uniref:TrbI/VirB10 family protein n=1 Tax=Luteimonas fraxinea TaxID=2901869 RepID=A0ABS8UF66_9GAMM|nr:TrbI/VirB10 family protein [Luteimonas fraxinea]MCD9098113.1 hypothetical protein [Luteimonas fraxinea]MCD9125356.1 hypothetical protein [Luteimonas fraxinea]UHH09161.1 hypothetical protein LU699_12770 [Luteimonas fraxinea]